MKGEIISVGTELLLGQIVNTNASFISQRLAELGIDVYYTTTVFCKTNFPVCAKWFLQRPRQGILRVVTFHQ